jgi:hypothetical protein
MKIVSTLNRRPRDQELVIPEERTPDLLNFCEETTSTALEAIS